MVRVKMSLIDPKILSTLKEVNLRYQELDAGPDAELAVLIVDLPLPILASTVPLQLRFQSKNAGNDETCLKGQTVHFMEMLWVAERMIPKERCGSLSRLTQLINRVLPCPGFYVDEMEMALIFRHNWIRTQELDTDAFRYLLSGVWESLNTFQDLFPEVADGKRSVDEIIREAHEGLAGGQI